MTVSINLTANTAQYVERIKQAKTQSERDLVKMERNFEDFARNVNDNFTSVDGAINSMLGSMRGMTGGGFAVGIGAIAAAGVAAAGGLSMMAIETMKAQRELERAAKLAGTSTEEFSKLAIVAQQNGLEVDKLGDIYKDVFDRIGDYVTAGTGPLQDFFDAIKGKSDFTIDDLIGKSAPEALSAIASELERVGASTAQITFVMESIASDSTLLFDAIKNGQDGLNQALEGYATKRALLSQDAINEISRMDSNFNSMWNNFGVMMSEKFQGLFLLVDKLARVTSDMFADSVEDMQRQKGIQDIIGGTFEVSISNVDEVKRVLKSIKDSAPTGEEITDLVPMSARKGEQTRGKTLEQINAGDEARFKESLALIEKQVSDVSKAREVQKQNAGTGGLGSGSGQSSSALTAQAKTVEEANKMIDESNKRSLKLEQDIAATKANIKQAEANGQTATAEAYRSQLTNQEKNLSDHNEKIKGLEESRSTLVERENQKRTAATQKAAQEAEKLERERAQAQLAVQTDEAGRLEIQYQQQIASFEDMLNKKLISQEQFNAKQKQLTEKHQKELADIERQKQTEQLQITRDVATTRQQEEDADLALRAQKLEEYRSSGKITQEQYDNAIAEARREHNSAMTEEDLKFVQDKNARDVMQAEADLAFLKEQHELGLISEQEFDEQRISAEQNVTNAKSQLLNAQLDQFSQLMSGVSNLAEKGSKQQKALFLAEKAATIAKVTMAGYEAWANVDKDPSIPTTAGKMIAKAGVVGQYGAQLASLASVTMGQFHSGTDEVSNTGSYILKQGERVVQPEANRDLTNYLANNEKGGKSVTINSDLVIQGGGDIDEAKFQSYLIKHRESVALAYTQASRENPNFR
ncbi:hypothetical protein HLBENOHH_02477 [Aeromonas dhakensis]|uniref:hypothetical protein n=1 Tax=Aeromonas dhakensis TaxID=196024 RepID=UPI00366FF004